MSQCVAFALALLTSLCICICMYSSSCNTQLHVHVLYTCSVDVFRRRPRTPLGGAEPHLDGIARSVRRLSDPAAGEGLRLGLVIRSRQRQRAAGRRRARRQAERLVCRGRNDQVAHEQSCAARRLGLHQWRVAEASQRRQRRVSIYCICISIRYGSQTLQCSHSDTYARYRTLFVCDPFYCLMQMQMHLVCFIVRLGKLTMHNL